MTDHAHSLSRRYIAAQTGSSFIRAQADEVAIMPRRAHRSAQNMVVRLVVTAIQFAVVALCVIVLAAWVTR